jgi:nucleosome assembly protein 1-like 1
LTKPLYERRNAIISGTAEPTPEEITAGEAQSLKDDPDYESLPAPTGADASSPANGIPEFWLTALRNHLGLSELITERDEGALKSLLDIRLSYLDTKREGGEGKPGFVLSFVFAPNEYFTNEVLTKTYIYQAEIGYGGDFVYDHAEGTEIKWKEDKDLTKEFEIKKQRNKSMYPVESIYLISFLPPFFFRLLLLQFAAIFIYDRRH